MRTQFRSPSLETLETRTVPSLFGGLGNFLGGLFGGGGGGRVQTLPSKDAGQVFQAFNTFGRTYSQDVRTILLPAGTTDATANRAAFDSAIASALGTLNASIDTAIQNLPTAASLAATIRGELLGTDSTSLQGQLAAITTPSSVSFRTSAMFTAQGEFDISQVAAEVAQQVRSAPAPSGSISAQTVSQDLQQVRSSFQTFSQTYSNNITTILLAGNGSTPTANRAQFDQSVGTALTGLNTSIDNALGNLPASVTTSLKTSIQNQLLSGGTNSSSNLQSQLASIPTPAGTRGLSAVFFRLRATLKIASTEGAIERQITTAVNQFNTTGPGSSATG